MIVIADRTSRLRASFYGASGSRHHEVGVDALVVPVDGFGVTLPDHGHDADADADYVEEVHGMSAGESNDDADNAAVVEAESPPRNIVKKQDIRPSPKTDSKERHQRVEIAQLKEQVNQLQQLLQQQIQTASQTSTQSKKQSCMMQ